MRNKCFYKDFIIKMIPFRLNNFGLNYFYYFILIICFSATYQLNAQPNYINLNFESNIRFEKNFYNQTDFHSNIKPFLPSEISSYDSLVEKSEIKNQSKLLYKLFNNNIFERSTKSYSIHLNPILNISPETSLNPRQTFNNYSAGLSIGGNLGNKFAFQLNGFYGIESFDQNIQFKIDSGNLLPGIGKYIRKDGNNYSYASITGYLSYSPSKYLNLQAGIGGNFWGDGYRSISLSDNGAKYPFFKATVNFWKFKYIWLFGYLNDFNSEDLSNKLKPKLLFSHYLSWNATKWLNFNFFESIVSNPIDSLGIRNFNVGYLNPVIFYRPLEFSGGSADNALLGFGFKLKLFKGYQFYNQITIDEFVWSEMKSGRGWWGNKFALQSGIKAFDLFNINNLYLQFEFNAVRPYTYSHSNSILNYGNNFQPLAHPTGANFEEIVFIIHYHKNRISALFKSIICKAGMDIDNLSYGQDIYKSYNHRITDYGNKYKQGFKSDYFFNELKLSWQINPKMNHELFLSLKKQQINMPRFNSNCVYISMGMRCLLWNNEFDYL